MSRVGKQQFTLPEKVEATLTPIVEEGFTGTKVTIKGPLGTLTRTFPSVVQIAVEDKVITCSRLNDTVHPALWGTTAAHISNMLEGVTKGYEKKLIIEGIGYRAELSGTNLVFALGFSHPVKMEVPEGLKVKVEKSTITITGIDKDKLGQFAAFIVSHKKPEPYKGKGIMYEGQYVRRKQGKRSTT